MVNYWIFPSNNVADSVMRGILGEWYLARQTVERSDIDIRKGDKVIIYQPGEVRDEPQKAGYNYIGNFTVDSEPFIQVRGENYYAINIRDFELWKKFVSKSEKENLETKIPPGSEFGRLIHVQVIIRIDKVDFEIIATIYGEQIEQDL